MEEVNGHVQGELETVKKSDLSTNAKEKLCKSCINASQKTANTFNDKYAAGAEEIAKLPGPAQDTAVNVFTSSMDVATDFINKALDVFGGAIVKALSYIVQKLMNLIEGVLGDAGKAVGSLANSAVSAISGIFG